MGIFTLFGGIIFMIVPITMAILMFQGGNFTIVGLGVIIILEAAGIGLLVFSIISLVRARRHKKISRTGKTATGNYLGHEGGVAINNVQLYKIIFCYTNDKGQEVRVESPSKYTYAQVTYYSQIGEFEIKYDEKDAVITHKPSHSQLAEALKNSYLGNQGTPGSQVGASQQEEYECTYCGGTQSNSGKCNFCGARTIKKRK